MIIINGTVTGQRLALDRTVVATGITIGQLKLSFSPEWDGYVKAAVFFKDKDKPYRTLFNDNGVADIPSEVATETGTCFIGAFGTLDNKVITTEAIGYNFRMGAITKDLLVPDPTPDIYAQLLSAYNTLGGAITDERLKIVCDSYIANHPDSIRGATTEQVAQISKNASDINSIEQEKVDKPSADDDGKIPRAKEGGVEWVEVGQPTDAQTTEAVTKWLDKHPEATTTVQDESLTYKKFELTQRQLLESATKIYVESIGIKTTNTGEKNTKLISNVLTNFEYNTNVEYVFSNGVYEFDGSIILKGNVILTGENNSVLKYTGNSDTFIIITSMNCKIRDIYISDEAGMKKSVTTGIQVGTENAYASHVNLSNLFITGFKTGLKTVNTWIDTFDSISCNFCKNGYMNDGIINASTFIRLNVEGNENGIIVKGTSLGLTFISICCEGNTSGYIDISSAGTISFLVPYFEVENEEAGSGCTYLNATGSCLITMINPLITYSCPFIFNGQTPKIIGVKNALVYIKNAAIWYPLLSTFGDYYIGISAFEEPLYNVTSIVSELKKGVELLDSNNYYSYGVQNAEDIRFNTAINFSQSLKEIDFCINNATTYNGRYLVIDVECDESLYGLNLANVFQLDSGNVIKRWNKSVDYSLHSKTAKALFDCSNRFQFYFLLSDVDSRSDVIYANITFCANVIIHNIALVKVSDTIV